ncbi:DASH family cryptochrome [Halorarius halobius]|uniref:DASH family cryptochrome n=1 Tax=Halorarius halobius TaxID=2962671 RepID=UPI0020CDB8F7|nr:DASH family cryptochrome [Halorarius halobius]
MSTALYWVRRDLRLHDNPTLRAAADADRLLPVYCVDSTQYGQQAYGGSESFHFQKTGSHRTRFRRESVSGLRERLADRGSDLLVRQGDPAEQLADLASAVDADAVHCQRLPAPEERRQLDRVRGALDAPVETHWTHTLHHVDDLPVPPAEIDDTFTAFRKQIEADSRVREPVDTPDLPPLPEKSPDRGAVPTLADVGLEEPPTDDRAVLPFTGGESRALDRLDEYVWDRDRLREYKRSRNGLLGADFSSKLSPWLNEGCLSPRTVFETVEAYEAERVANDSTYWLVFELRWRDFFQFQQCKHGGTLFTREGIRDRTDIDWRTDETAFRRWADGETGIPFVDAAMRELNATGYQSNRARQNAASFLANDLRIDWRRGAAYFETQLVDYDPGSNYGNWAYIAGVGNDSRNRSFDVLSQAERYDEHAEYVKTWCPELDPLPAEMAHQPWTMNEGLQATYGVEVGVDYPRPMLDPDRL